jgi:hypothetical protein
MKILSNLQQTVRDLNRRWGWLGALVIIFVTIASVVSSIMQIMGSIQPSQGVTITIPVAWLAMFSLLVVSAIVSLVFQLGSTELMVKKSGITQLTNVYVQSNRGELYYGTKRNVLLRLETIQEILRSIFIDGLEVSLANERLRQLGNRVGLSFADGFVDQIDKQRLLLGEKNLANMIDAWCDYDIEAGWGRFQYSPVSEWLGRIEVRSNFLTTVVDGKQRLSRSICSFMEGYIAGVLELFAVVVYPTKKWHVEVTERECGVNLAGQKPCAFEFCISEEQTL